MKLISLFALWAASLGAAPVFTLDPNDPVRSGAPGTSVTWGLSVAPDSAEWIAVTASFVLAESNPSLGFYVDLIGSQGGPTGGVLPPSPQPDWLTDLGQYFIDPFAPVGALNTGNIRILYERFSDDPSTCVNCYLGSGEADLDFTVNVDAPPVPEPGTWLLTISAAAAILVRRRSTHR